VNAVKFPNKPTPKEIAALAAKAIRLGVEIGPIMEYRKMLKAIEKKK